LRACFRRLYRKFNFVSGGGIAGGQRRSGGRSRKQACSAGSSHPPPERLSTGTPSQESLGNPPRAAGQCQDADGTIGRIWPPPPEAPRGCRLLSQADASPRRHRLPQSRPAVLTADRADNTDRGSRSGPVASASAVLFVGAVRPDEPRRREERRVSARRTTPSLRNSAVPAFSAVNPPPSNPVPAAAGTLVGEGATGFILRSVSVTECRPIRVHPRHPRLSFFGRLDRFDPNPLSAGSRCLGNRQRFVGH